eukprot:scaffold91123_cov15-Tisochrysis_lutea.AAC.2
MLWFIVSIKCAFAWAARGVEAKLQGIDPHFQKGECKKRDFMAKMGRQSVDLQTIRGCLAGQACMSFPQLRGQICTLYVKVGAQVEGICVCKGG